MNNELNLEAEQTFVTKAYESYHDDSSFNKEIRRCILKTFSPYLSKHMKALELGCSNGFLSSELAQLVGELTIVDGSAKAIEDTRLRMNQQRIENTLYKESLFENFVPLEKYDAIFAVYILEHVLDTQIILDLAKSCLKENGIFCIVVPNARALSRQLALKMGMYESLYHLTENDFNHGHRRVYDSLTLAKSITDSGFAIISKGGVILKPLADFQLDNLLDKGFLTEKHIDGMYDLGFEYPDLCGSLFAISILNK